MNRRRFLVATGAAAATGAGTLGYARFVEPGRVEFTDHTLPAGPGLPKIAQISDLHLRGLGAPHETIAAEIDHRAPELIAITGDSVDDDDALPLLAGFLDLLPTATPKLAILGNWEHWGGVDAAALRRVYQGAGCDLLVNRSALVETEAGAIRVSGVDDLVGGRPDLGAVTPPDPHPGFHLLLAHCPAHRDRIADRRAFDLVLSGHTHGGQVQVLGYAPFVPRGSGRYREGWYRGDGGPPLYVSRGVGTSVLPVRLGARPEVAFFSPPPAAPGPGRV